MEGSGRPGASCGGYEEFSNVPLRPSTRHRRGEAPWPFVPEVLDGTFARIGSRGSSVGDPVRRTGLPEQA